MIPNPVVEWATREGHDEERRDTPEDATADRSIARMAFYGALGGLIATGEMTAFRLPISRSLPPTAEFWARYVGGGDPEEYTAEALALHLLYGIGGGLAYAPLFDAVKRRTSPESEVIGLFWGTLYGLVLSVFGLRVVLGRLLGMELEPDEAIIFHASHAIYGLTLGAWLGSRT